jgi:hypothetical protein
VPGVPDPVEILPLYEKSLKVSAFGSPAAGCASTSASGCLWPRRPKHIGVWKLAKPWARSSLSRNPEIE